MKNFNYYAPTRIYFGKGEIRNLSKELRKYGERVLMVYGGGSIKRTGIYDAVMEEISDEFTVTEHGGVKPNPRLSHVREGITLARENDVDVILAVGGGSTIDASKAIAAGAKSTADAWDIVSGKARIREAIPIVVVLTINATGSEMNANAVISNEETKEKLGFASEAVIPAHPFSIRAISTRSPRSRPPQAPPTRSPMSTRTIFNGTRTPSRTHSPKASCAPSWRTRPSPSVNPKTTTHAPISCGRPPWP